MDLQTFFPEMGDDAKLRLELTVIEEQIESINRLRRHAVKIGDGFTLEQVDKELKDMRETERATRSLLAMRTHSMPVRQDQCERNSGADDGQPVMAYMSDTPGRKEIDTLKSNSPSSLCGEVGGPEASVGATESAPREFQRTKTQQPTKEQKCS